MNLKILIGIFVAAVGVTFIGFYFLAELGLYVAPKFMKLSEEHPILLKFITLVSIVVGFSSLWFNRGKQKT